MGGAPIEDGKSSLHFDRTTRDPPHRLFSSVLILFLQHVERDKTALGILLFESYSSDKIFQTLPLWHEIKF